MKTKFFKKLSFVLVVAMVLSLFVPATGAFASSGAKLNSTKKYLHLGRIDTGENDFNFNIDGKQKGWKYSWESANEDVAVVDEKNGVTVATGVGKTKITVYITDADDEEVDELSATVTVRDNIKEVTIANPIEKLAVGETHDYNRDFETESGSTAKTSAITRWTVEPAEGAEIDDKGNFTASVAGEFAITARSFQSKAKYADWQDDPEKYADYVLDTDETKVTVSAFMVSAKQNNLSKVNVLFSSPMTKDEVKENIYVHYMIGDVAINEQAIKDVSMSDDGLTATVEIYDKFVPKMTYRVTYTGMDYQEFIAATTNPEDVVAIDITTTTAKIYTDTTVSYNLLNKDGVVINQPTDVSNLGARVTFENSNELTSLLYDKLMIFKLGDSTTVTATYHTYDGYDAQGNETVYKDSQVITGVEDAEVSATDVLAWTIVTDRDPKFDEVKQFIAAGDFGRELFVQVQLNDNDKSKVSSKDNPLFRLTSSDSSILFVDETGYLIPVKAGSVIVTVEYDKKYVGSFKVLVSAERKAARLKVEDSYYANVSNSDGFDGLWSDDKTVKVNLLDQYGDKFADTGKYTPNLVMKAISAKAIADTAAEAPITTEFTFNPSGRPEGKYQYLIYDLAYENFTGQVVFDVRTPVEAKVAASWKLEISGDAYKDGNIDVVVKEAADANKTFSVSLMAYARNGVKIGPVDLSDTSTYTVNVRDPKGQPVVASGSAFTFNSTWVSDDATVSPGAIVKLDKGRYSVDVLQGTSVKARGVFVVVDSQTAPKVSVKKFRSDFSSGAAAFADCFTVKIGDTEYASDALTPEFESTIIPTRAFVKKVFVRENIANSAYYIMHEVNVGYYITVPIDFDGYTD